ncbi:MAG: hypothetical protein ABII90_07310 [Bacteroidota bacterium]
MDAFTWTPQSVYSHEINYRTLVSKFESGAEQRRKKWTSPLHKFVLVFNRITNTVDNAIRVHYSDCYGAYDTFVWINILNLTTLQLNGAMDISQVTLTYDTLTGGILPSNGIILIDTERILYTGITRTTPVSGTLSGLVRGYGGSVAATHLDDAPIVTNNHIVRYEKDSLKEEYINTTTKRISEVTLIQVK